jgi:L-ascorbate metabolism protein UlaG (beta-lactamase superfamily)
MLDSGRQQCYATPRTGYEEINAMKSHQGKFAGLSIVVSLMLAALASTAAAQQERDSGMAITYVGNTGFLVEWSDRKVLIDGLCSGEAGGFYDLPQAGEAERISGGRPPFDGIDLVLVSHYHEDHFNPQMVERYLIGNSKTQLICTPQAHDRLKNLSGYGTIAARIHEVIPQPGAAVMIETGAIKTTVLGLKHGSYWETDSTGAKYDRHAQVENLGFVVDLGGCRLFHPGDDNVTDTTLYANLHLRETPMQVAFVTYWAAWARNEPAMNVIKNLIAPGAVVLMHIPFSQRESGDQLDVSGIPDAIIFHKRMETRFVPCPGQD